MSKSAPVIGHNARSHGAVGVIDKRTEYYINSAIWDLDPGALRDHAPHGWYRGDRTGLCRR